jgi:hypothetical protein
MQYSGPSAYDRYVILSVVPLATLTKVKTSIVPASFRGNLLFRAVRTELLEIGPEVAGFFFVLDAGKIILVFGILARGSLM